MSLPTEDIGTTYDKKRRQYFTQRMWLKGRMWASSLQDHINPQDQLREALAEAVSLPRQTQNI